MTWRNVRESLDQAVRLPHGPVRRMLTEAGEHAAWEAAAEAVECARRAVQAADRDLLGDALGWICAAAGPATEARTMAWPWWWDKRSDNDAA